MARQGKGILSVLLIRESLIDQPKNVSLAIRSKNSFEYIVNIPSVDTDLIPRQTKTGRFHVPSTVYFKEIEIDQGVYSFRVVDEIFDVFHDIPIFIGKVTPLNAHFVVGEDGVLLMQESKYFLEKKDKYLSALRPYFYHVDDRIHSKRFPHRVLMHVDFRGQYANQTVNKVEIQKLSLVDDLQTPLSFLQDTSFLKGEFKEISHGFVEDPRGSRHHSYYNFVFDLPSFGRAFTKCYFFKMSGNFISKKGNQIKKTAFGHDSFKNQKVCLKNGDYHSFQKMDLRFDFDKSNFNLILLDHQTGVPVRQNF